MNILSDRCDNLSYLLLEIVCYYYNVVE